MKKDTFFELLSEALELDVYLNEDSDLSKFPEWDSMAAMVVIAISSDSFGVVLTGEEIEKVTTVYSLMKFIGLEKFED
jgi:acyl carrier protein